MKDFLGQEYGPGDKVLYAAMSGRSVTMVLAEVVSVTEFYRDHDSYKWVPLAEGEQPPFERVWNHDIRDFADTEERVETELRVKVQPLNSSRWTQHHGRDKYIDTRTGKSIDPFRSDQHHVGGYWEHKETGERVTDDDLYRDDRFRGVTRYSPEQFWPEGWRHVPWDFAPHVKKLESEVKPVTLTVTDNIVLWKRKNREDHPEWRACKS